MSVETLAQLPPNMATSMLSGHLQVKDLPSGATDLHLSTHTSPKCLQIWRCDSATLIHSTQTPSSKSTLHFTAVAFSLFVTFCLLACFESLFSGWQAAIRMIFPPSVAFLTAPSFCTALLGRRAQGKNSTKRPCSVAVSLR